LKIDVAGLSNASKCSFSWPGQFSRFFESRAHNSRKSVRSFMRVVSWGEVYCPFLKPVMAALDLPLNVGDSFSGSRFKDRPDACGEPSFE